MITNDHTNTLVVVAGGVSMVHMILYTTSSPGPPSSSQKARYYVFLVCFGIFCSRMVM